MRDWDTLYAEEHFVPCSLGLPAELAMKNTFLPIAVAFGVLVVPAAAGNPTDCDPLLIEWSKPFYNPGEQISLKVEGTPGTLGILYLNSDSGPLVVPGLGTFDVGGGPGLIQIPIKPIPASGERFFSCELKCDGSLSDFTLYTQALSISPLATQACISNSDVLIVTDETCFEGCTPGLWKNKTEHWDPTGYSPDDDFDTVFGVDLFNPDITLLQAAKDVGKGELIFSAHAVAALLNATHPDVNYAFTEATVIQLVQDAVQANEFEATKDVFDTNNNAGCPL